MNTAKLINDLQNEGAEGYNHEDTPTRRAAADKAWGAKIDATWNKDATIAKHAAWNAEVAKHESITPAAYNQIVKAVGFEFATLRKHIARHSL